MEVPSLLEHIEMDVWTGGPSEIKVVPLGGPATIEDLRRTRLKAEIVDGQLMVIGPSGAAHGRAVGAVLRRLMEHELPEGTGRAFGARVGYIVDLPHRQAFCPDVSWYTGPPQADFPRGAPIFAAEIRDIDEYGDGFDRHAASKRSDYFAAGTKVVWDVDVLREGLVRVYRSGDPEHPTVYRRGEMAEAEPAVPGWTMAMDELFT